MIQAALLTWVFDDNQEKYIKSFGLLQVVDCYFFDEVVQWGTVQTQWCVTDRSRFRFLSGWRIVIGKEEGLQEKNEVFSDSITE